MTQTVQSDADDSALHRPVLLREVIAMLEPAAGERYLDVTAGYGGHATAVLAKTGSESLITLVDRDPAAIKVLKRTFARARIIQSDFAGASEQLLAGSERYDMILADLGVSSPHLNNPERGFAFGQDGPLDMRMDQSQPLTAETVVNTYSAEKLQHVLRVYGEEPRAHKITQLIVQHRPLHTTGELADVIKKAYPRWHKTHPATRTFQAIRIAVNDELGQIEAALPRLMELLAPGGRLAIISFHSLEDRIVKQTFHDAAGEGYDARYRLLAKKPITASEQELVFNPRARSSKLRGVAKIKNKEREATYADSG